jgi:hypothetical protein
MKRQTIIARQLAAAILLLVTFSSCMKDKCSHTFRLYKPITATLTEVRANMKSNAPKPLKTTGKIYVYGNYIFLNELNRGIHVIDNSQPASPKNMAFINIPGNIDMAVKGNILYADSYSELVTFDISNPKQVVLKNVSEKVFPQAGGYFFGTSINPDSIRVVVDWIEKDTTVECETYSYLYANFYSLSSADKSGYYASTQIGGGGAGGSMARFTLMNDYLYTVTWSDIKSFDLAVPLQPVLKSTVQVDGGNIETVFPFKDRLFIGSMNGMYIYDVSSPGNPVKQGQFSHVRSCDPVIVDGDKAYVTLRSGTKCQGFTNQLDVVSVANMYSPSILKTYNLTNPHGLSKDGNLLFICDGEDGLKIYNATDIFDMKLVKRVGGMKTFDVITWNKKAIVVAEDGLYQFDYSNTNDIRLLSKMELQK